jgi:hypothetical protein
MDNLDNLPLKEDTNPNSHEEEVMGKFFTPPGQRPSPSRGSSNGHSRGPPQNTAPERAVAPEPEGINWKLIGYTTLLFVALANPWLDTLLCKVPYCGDNAFTLLGMKVLAFALLYVIVTVYFG